MIRHWLENEGPAEPIYDYMLERDYQHHCLYDRSIRAALRGQDPIDSRYWSRCEVAGDPLEWGPYLGLRLYDLAECLFRIAIDGFNLSGDRE